MEWRSMKKQEAGDRLIGSHIATKPLRQNDIRLTYAPIAGM
jgi:hypothetical protein